MKTFDPTITSTILASLRYLREELATGRAVGTVSTPALDEAITALERPDQPTLPVLVCIEGGTVAKVFADRPSELLVVDLDQHWQDKAVAVPVDDGLPPKGLIFTAEVEVMGGELAAFLRGHAPPPAESDTLTASFAF